MAILANDFTGKVRAMLCGNKPKIIVFSGKHHPLEPLSEVAEALQPKYSPRDVFFVEFPFNHTPLGQALDGYTSLIQYIRKTKAGKKIIKGYNAKEQKKFGELLERARVRTESHQEGLIASETRLEEIFRDIIDTTEVDFRQMLRALRLLTPVIPGEEIIVHDLSADLPGTQFISLHGKFVFALHHAMILPYNEINATAAAVHLHDRVTTALGKGIWDSYQYQMYSLLIRQMIGAEEFNRRFNYAYMELPLGCSPDQTTPAPNNEMIRAIIGSYFFPNPFWEIDPSIKTGHYDITNYFIYFRSTKFSNGHRRRLIEDVGNYLDQLLKLLHDT